MKLIRTLEKVIDSGIIPKGLLYVPSSGASEEEIDMVEKLIDKKLSEFHKAILKRWNGLHLDIINFFGCINVAGSIHSLVENQPSAYELIEIEKAYISFADDPVAYLYIEGEEGDIEIVDIKSGNREHVAHNLEEFICDYVFGSRAEEFAGFE